MSLSADFQKLEPGDVVRLFAVDGTAFGTGEVLRFHSYSLAHTEAEILAAGGDENKLPAKSIWWQGEEYKAWPWSDPGNAYADAMEPVFEQALVARYGFNQLEMTAIGCTRQSEANRKGRWGILTNNKDRVISFDVGLDGNIPQPGYIIAVADELLSGKVMGGRISAVNGRVIKLDRVADAAAGDRLILNLPSGASQSRTIQAVNGESVTVTTAYSETPQAEAVWVVESDGLYAQQYRVVSVSDNDDGTFSITGACGSAFPDRFCLHRYSGRLPASASPSLRHQGKSGAPASSARPE